MGLLEFELELGPAAAWDDVDVRGFFDALTILIRYTDFHDCGLLNERTRNSWW